MRPAETSAETPARSPAFARARFSYSSAATSQRSSCSRWRQISSQTPRGNIGAPPLLFFLLLLPPPPPPSSPRPPTVERIRFFLQELAQREDRASRIIFA